METFRVEKTIGWLFIVGAVLVLIPYTALTLTFDYPSVLREDAGVILTRFRAGGGQLIGLWWAFALVGFPLLPAIVLLGQKLENKVYFVRWATTLGVLAVVLQIIGLLRWTFVVPVLAESYASAASEATREANKVVFRAIHQYGGVVLGEHLGQLLTIAWTVLMALAIEKIGLLPRWTSRFAYVASGIYLLAQGELFATVIPGFPVWELAGLLGSTLWLAWLVIIGLKFLRLRME